MSDDLSSAQEKRAALWRLLGAPERPAPQASVKGAAPFAGWVLEDLEFTGCDGEPVPAWFLRPPEPHPPVPAVLYCHAHGNRYETGRDELTAGRPALAGPYAPDFIALGCAALIMEMPGFGARRSPGEAARARGRLWRGETLFGQMLAELSAGLGFLERHEMVDAERIGALGLSMGCTHALWLAALDERIKAAAGLCCFADLETLIRVGAHQLHGEYMTVPGLIPAFRTGEIAGLAAPRALLIGAGMADQLTPPDAFAAARHDLEAAYKRAGAADMLSFHIETQSGHEETPAMREAVLAFLRGRLIAQSGA